MPDSNARRVNRLAGDIFGDDILIEANTIEVLPREGGPPVPVVPPAIGTAGAPAGVNTPPDPITLGDATRGGIQLCRRLRSRSYPGQHHSGWHLEWHHARSLRIVGSNDPDDIPDKPTSEDPCFPCRPPDLTDEPDPDNPDIRFESAGDLYEIKIAGNRITDMGINGIGVVRFFNLATAAT